MDTVRDLLNWRSLRWKTTLLVAVACCAIALTVGVLVHRSTLARSMNDGGAKATAELDRAVEDSRRDGGPPEGLETSPAAMPAELLDRLRHGPGPSTGHATWYDGDGPGDHPRMWAARMYGDRPVAIAIDMTSDLLTRRALDRHMWKYSVLALGVVLPLTALAAELPHRRLRRVARTARRIAAGDLAARTADGREGREGHADRGGRGGRGDEITEISATVDSMADSLLGRLAAEQRFTADVAHELRTPLMGLVTASGLLPEGRPPTSSATGWGCCGSWWRTCWRSPGWTRAPNAPKSERSRWPRSSGNRWPAPDCRMRFTPDGAGSARTDPRRVDRIVANLVLNAHRHGGAPVEVAVTGTTVTVRDHGPGFPRELLADGPRRFRTGASERGRGHGLGLTIALGQARVVGASLSFANASDGGAVATLRLPVAD